MINKKEPDKKTKGRPTMAQYLLYLQKGIASSRKEMAICFGKAKQYLVILRENKLMPQSAKDKLIEAVRVNRFNAKLFIKQKQTIQYEIDNILNSRNMND